MLVCMYVEVIMAKNTSDTSDDDISDLEQVMNAIGLITTQPGPAIVKLMQLNEVANKKYDDPKVTTLMQFMQTKVAKELDTATSMVNVGKKLFNMTGADSEELSAANTTGTDNTSATLDDSDTDTISEIAALLQ